MMLCVIVFYTFGIINYVHVTISISKKSVTHDLKIYIFKEFIPTLLNWMRFKKKNYVTDHNAKKSDH